MTLGAADVEGRLVTHAQEAFVADRTCSTKASH